MSKTGLNSTVIFLLTDPRRLFSVGSYVAFVSSLFFSHLITKTCLFKYMESYTVFKQKTDMFHISAQKINFGHSLEPPQKHRLFVIDRTASARRSNEYPQSMF